MKTRPPMFRLLALATILAMVGGCAGVPLRPVDVELAREGTGLRDESGQRIAGYLLFDATEHEYKGQVRLVGSDSLAFWTKQPADGPTLALTSVAALRVVDSSGGAGEVVVIALILGLAVVGIGFAVSDGDIGSLSIGGSSK